jgi:hypothetical protein
MMRILKHVLEAAFITGLAIAYLAAVAGLLGWVGARDVTALTLYGGAFSLLIAVAYFIVASLEIRHRVSSVR